MDFSNTSPTNKKLKDNLYSAIEFVKNYKFCFLALLISSVIFIITFHHNDGRMITAYSFSFWDALFSGRMNDFYAVTAEGKWGISTGISSTEFVPVIPLAIWNFPMWLIQTVTSNYSVNNFATMFWSRLFLFICLIAIAIFTRKIALKLGCDTKTSDYSLLLVLCSGTGMISVGCMGQNEVFYILSFLIGFYYLLSDRTTVSYVCFGFSIICFPFMALPVLIALLVRKAEITKIVLLIVCSVAIKIICDQLVGVARQTNPDGITSIEKWINWFFFSPGFNLGTGVLSIFGAIALIVVIYSLFVKSDDANRTSVVCMAIIFLSMFVFTMLFPQRYFVCIPFTVLGVMVACKNNRNALNVGLFLLLILEYATTICATYNPGGFDYGSMDFGNTIMGNILHWNFNYTETYITLLTAKFSVIPLLQNLIVTVLFVACISLIYLIVKKPRLDNIITINEKYILILYPLSSLVIMVLFFGVPIALKLV